MLRVIAKGIGPLLLSSLLFGCSAGEPAADGGGDGGSVDLALDGPAPRSDMGDAAADTTRDARVDANATPSDALASDSHGTSDSGSIVVDGGVIERPWAHNTGPSDPGLLQPWSGSTTLGTPNQTYESFELVGGLTIDADNVTLRNFRIQATTSYGIKIVDGHKGIVIEDGEIYDMSSAAILGVGYTGRRLHIHDSSGDGLKAQGTGGPTLVERSFIEKLGKGDAAHADGDQTRGGSDITFRHNNIYMPYPGTPDYPGEPYKSNATFMLQLTISNFIIEANWLTGGNYTIYCSAGARVINNIFGLYNGGWAAGKHDLRLRSGTCQEWSGNVWEDTGLPTP